MRGTHHLPGADDEHIVEQIVRGLALIVVAGAALGGLTSIVAIKFVDALLGAI
jgi:hypothetical protein